MQLNSPPVVPDEVPGNAAVFRTRPITALEIKEQAKDQSENDQRCQDLAEAIPDDPGLEEVQAKGAAQEKNVGDKPGLDAIQLVERPVPCGCDGAGESFPGQPEQQHALEYDEDEYDRNGAQAWPGPMGSNRAPSSPVKQRYKRAVERLEGANDPEDDRGGWG